MALAAGRSCCCWTSPPPASRPPSASRSPTCCSARARDHADHHRARHGHRAARRAAGDDDARRLGWSRARRPRSARTSWCTSSTWEARAIASRSSRSSDLYAYYGRSHALQGVRPGGRARAGRAHRPQRHGQDHAVQRDHGPAARRARLGQASAGRRSSARSRTRSAAPASATCRRAAACSPSLSTDEHLRMRGHARRRRWTPDRVYELFPRLAERAQGERQRSCPAASSRCSRSAARW